MRIIHKMTIGYIPDKEETNFILSEEEFKKLLTGKSIKHVTSNFEYKIAEFTLSFKGKKR